MADAAVLETTLLHLRAQTVRERIEIIIATPSRSDLGPLPVDLDGFYDWRVLEVPTATNGAHANAAAVRAARAPIVAFAEDTPSPTATGARCCWNDTRSRGARWVPH